MKSLFQWKIKGVMEVKESRTLYLYNEINKDNVSTIFKDLLKLLENDKENEDREKNFKRKPIKIFINSNGGYVDDMWALVDVIINSKTPIYTYCTSYAHSCGFLIFIAGHKRFITKHANMICHQFYGGVYGTYQDIKEKIIDMDRLWRDFEEYICTQTKITRLKLQDVMEKKINWTIYSEESIELGVATDIITEF